MKNFTSLSIFVLTLIISVFQLSAQTLPSNVLPKIGDVVMSVSADTTGVHEGTIGSGIIWDFANLTASSTPTTTTYVHPNETPDAANFFGTNLASVTEGAGSTTYTYYSKEGNDLFALGNVTDFSTNKYVNTELVLPTPLTANDYEYDEFAGVTEMSSSTLYHAGIKDFEIDASGTLILPSGTFENAIRVSVTGERIDSSTTGSSTVLIVTDFVQFDWYIPNQAGPVLSIIYIEGESIVQIAGMDDIVNEIPLSKAVVFNPEVTGGSGEPTALFEVENAPFDIKNLSPNPASIQVTIEFESSEVLEATLNVVSLIGKVLHSENITVQQGMNLERVEIDEYPKGTYFLTLKTKKSIISRRFFKH